jgi:hypothetical protein
MPNNSGFVMSDMHSFVMSDMRCFVMSHMRSFVIYDRGTVVSCTTNASWDL